jgi:polyketide cyclase/dehydrase/lipid transport protein
VPVERHYSESTVIDASPEQVYDLVTDIARTGEWSPICRACWWVDGGGPRVGAWFHGRNEIPGRTWETESLVVAAEPGQEFAWLVGGRFARWGYTMRPVDGGTELTESWEFRDEGIAMFHDKYGERADEQIEARTSAAHEGIPATLAALKRILENPA